MTIQFYRREVYGNTLYYFVDNDQALAFKRLTGKRTVSRSDMHYFEKLGISFLEVLQPVI